MGLTLKEVEEFKRQCLESLEVEESQRIAERTQDERERRVQPDPAQDDLVREEELKRLKAQVEEQFYKNKGYKRYVDHKGRVLWLTPKEYAFRKKRRSQNQARAGGGPVLRTQVQTLIIYLVIAVVAMAAGVLLTR